MAEKVPSFKSGGAYWFVDLTTPDALYIFPVLTALTFLITVEVRLLCQVIFSFISTYFRRDLVPRIFLNFFLLLFVLAGL